MDGNDGLGSFGDRRLYGLRVDIQRCWVEVARRVVGQARQVDDGVHALHELGVVGDVDDIGLDELEVRVAEKQGHGLISEIEPVETQDFVAFVHEPPR